MVNTGNKFSSLWPMLVHYYELVADWWPSRRERWFWHRWLTVWQHCPFPWQNALVSTRNQQLIKPILDENVIVRQEEIKRDRCGRFRRGLNFAVPPIAQMNKKDTKVHPCRSFNWFPWIRCSLILDHIPVYIDSRGHSISSDTVGFLQNTRHSMGIVSCKE